MKIILIHFSNVNFLYIHLYTYTDVYIYAYIQWGPFLRYFISAFLWVLYDQVYMRTNIHIYIILYRVDFYSYSWSVGFCIFRYICVQVHTGIFSYTEGFIRVSWFWVLYIYMYMRTNIPIYIPYTRGYICLVPFGF